MSEENFYKMGSMLVFSDANATTSTGEAGMNQGPINGPPIRDDDGEVVYIPVFAARDNGREATTIFVAVDNVVSVDP